MNEQDKIHTPIMDKPNYSSQFNDKQLLKSLTLDVRLNVKGILGYSFVLKHERKKSLDPYFVPFTFRVSETKSNDRQNGIY